GGEDASSGAVYTLTNSAAGNAVAVFARSGAGTLSPQGSVSTGGLGTGSNLGSQGAVVLSDNGRRLFAVNAGSNTISELAVTPRGLQLVATYAGGSDGRAGAPVVSHAAGSTPFGFDFDNRGHLLTSDAGGTASSYALADDGTATPITGAVATHQGAPCWLIATKNGRYAYTAN